MRIAEADLGLTSQALDKMNGVRTNPDDRLRIQFMMFPEIDKAATDREGRPIYADKEYITIMVPGDRDVVHRAVWERDKERFPQQYAAFKNKQNQDAVSGTPLKMVPWLSLGQVKELEYFNCYTLEQLAAMPDSTSQKFMQINKLKQMAKDHVQAAKEAAPLTAMRAEMDEKDNRIATLEKQMAELLKRAKAAEAEVEAD